MEPGGLAGAVWVAEDAEVADGGEERAGWVAGWARAAADGAAADGAAGVVAAGAAASA